MTTKVVVRHFHDGNDADKTIRSRVNPKHPAVYATHARIVDLDTGLTLEALVPEPGGHGFIEMPAEVWAFCNNRDVPSRKQGRSISLGRLQKLFPDECAKADFGVFEDLRVSRGDK